MFHTVGWFENIATGTTPLDIQPLPDGQWAIQNNHFIPQFDYDMLYFATIGLSIIRSQLTSASIRQFSPLEIHPVSNDEALASNQPNVADYRHQGFTISGLEELIYNAAQNEVGNADTVAMAGFTRNFVPAPVGQVYSMRGTGATTVTADAWSLVTPTWADNLPSGQYTVVGLKAVGATALAARLIFENQWERPGCQAVGLIESASWEGFNRGGLGSWGAFDSNRPPNLEFWCSAADTAQEFIMDFVRTG